MNDVYARLSARFDRHHKDPRGLEYLTGEQVVSRLNDVLGPGSWSFVVREHGYDQESDEIWVRGNLTATIDGQLTEREQFGSQKHNRLRSTSKIIDYGFDMKGAATDALKKCATLIGIGLYLSEKEGGIPQQVEDAPKAIAPAARTAAVAPATTQRAAVPTEPNSAPTAIISATPAPSTTTRLDDALGWWEAASERAAELHIEHKQLPEGATLSQVERWTKALIDKINAVERQEAVA